VYNDTSLPDAGAKRFLQESSFDSLLRESSAWWEKTWQKSDIVIEGDQ
jgi:hypothetical protein